MTEFASLDLVNLEDLIISGWDIRAGKHAMWARQHGIVPSEILDTVESDLTEIHIIPAPYTAIPNSIQQLDRVEQKCDTVSRRDAVKQLKADIRIFRETNNVNQCIVVYLASTEPPAMDSQATETLSSFEKAIDSDSSAITSGMLYAYAAISERCAFVNFTPNITYEVPALLSLAEELNIVTAGRDGKTGQTLYKTVIAPMLHYRNLRLTGWFSTNILGNSDGRALKTPENVASKISTKRGVLSNILGYDDFEHQVHIHYYPPHGDAKESWDAIDFQGWLETPMSMRINWHAHDSLLAAPLVVDLIRLVAFTSGRNIRCGTEHLASFFKKPNDGSTNDFFQQVSALFDFSRRHGNTSV